MAKLPILCPSTNCGFEGKIDESWVGRVVKCPKCKTKFAAQLIEKAPPPPTVATSTVAPRPARPVGEDGIPIHWEPGDVILDLYEVREIAPGVPFGKGGMGRVNLVRHREWQVDLAVKSVNPEMLKADPQAVANFQREAEEWVNKIGFHPHVVGCHYVRVLGGMLRVFIEYVAGGDLSEWIGQRGDGRLYSGTSEEVFARILDVAIQFARGLHYIHALGMVHQDVKPPNVMMSADGIAKVTDFGLVNARAVTFQEEIAGKLVQATYRGRTERYCSPEQAEIAAKRKAGVPHERCEKLTLHTDMWSWAASVLEMFHGGRRWGDAGVLAGIYIDANPVDSRIPKMPKAAAELLRRCLQQKPKDRPRDMTQVVNDLLTIYRQVTGHEYGREVPRAAESLAASLNNRAVSLLDLDKPEEAEALWNEALRIDPHHPEATFNRGLVRWRSVRQTDQELLKDLREVWASSSDVGWVDYLTGLVHLERTDARGAVRSLSSAAKNHPDHEEITAALARARAACVTPERFPGPFNGHTEKVNSVSWSPDGRFALSGGRDGVLRLWNVLNGECKREFGGAPAKKPVVSQDEIGSVAWSADGATVFSATQSGYLRQWDVSTGAVISTLEFGRSIWFASLSPDGQYALSGGSSGDIQYWDILSGSLIHTLEKHKADVYAVSWSSDGSHALSGSRDQTMVLWNVDTGSHVQDYGKTSVPLIDATGAEPEVAASFARTVTSVALSPDGCFALAGFGGSQIILTNLVEDQPRRTFLGHTRSVMSVAFSPDGTFALSGSRDKTVRLWEVATGRCLRTTEGHTGEVVSVAFSPDGRFALSGGWDNTLRLAEISAISPAPLVLCAPATPIPSDYHRLLEQAWNAVDSSPTTAAEGLRKARQQPGCGRRREALELARWLSRSLAHRCFAGGWEGRIFEGHAAAVTSVAFRPDGRFAISGSKDKTLRLWEVHSGKCLRTYTDHTHPVNSVAFSPDGRFILSGSVDGTMRQWHISNPKSIQTYEEVFDNKPLHDEITSVSWSPDGRSAVSASDTMLRQWEVSTGRCARRFEGVYETFWDPPFATSWSPDGRFVFAGGLDGTLVLSDVSSGKMLRTVEGAGAPLRAVAVSPDGHFSLSGGGDVPPSNADYSLRLFEVSSGTRTDPWLGHTGPVTSVAFSPDGRFAVSGSRDRTVRLWEVATGRCLRTFEGHTHPVNSVAFSPDGRFALSGSDDLTVRLWELDWEFEPNPAADWAEGARSFLTTFLTLRATSVTGLVRRGKPTWTDNEFRALLEKLGRAGYGWLRPEGVSQELKKMATNWSGPPPLTLPL